MHHNSAIDNEAFTMCFIRKFKSKRLNLLTNSKEKRYDGGMTFLVRPRVNID